MGEEKREVLLEMKNLAISFFNKSGESSGSPRDQLYAP